MTALIAPRPNLRCALAGLTGLLLMGLLLLGCGSSPGSSAPTSASSGGSSTTLATATSTTTATSGTSTVGCPAVSEVNAALGKTFTLQKSQPLGAGVQCSYVSGSGGFSLDLNPDSAESTIPAALKSVVTTVPGVGNWAFWQSASETFEAYKGTTFVGIVWDGQGGAAPAASSFANLARRIL
jgi:hypothetical protein